MPTVKSKNGLKQGTFCKEFNYYLEKRSCMNGNIDGLVQIVCTKTHRCHHLLDKIITKKDCNITSDSTVSDFISYHIALHVSLQCIRPQPVRKQIVIREIRRIKDDAIVKDLDKSGINQRCVDVDTMVEMYERVLSELLDMFHKNIKVVDRALNEWMTDSILISLIHSLFGSQKVTLLPEYTFLFL